MSGLYQAEFQAAEPVRAVLTTTLVDIVPPSDKKQPIAKIHVCNVTATAAAFDIGIFDGTNTIYIENGRVVSPNTSFELRDEVLQVGHSLRMRAGTATALHASVIFSLGAQIV